MAPSRRVDQRSQRPCVEWHPEGCVLGFPPGEDSPWCVFVGRCMYATDRGELAPQVLELWDAWCNGRLCMLWYAPSPASGGAC